MIYILMEIVDLGGHPHLAYTDKAKAEAELEARNLAHRVKLISDLVTHCKYTEEAASALAAGQNHYYIEEVELL